MTEPPEDKTLLHILMHIGKLLQQEIAAELTTSGLHHGQGRILAILQSHGELTQAELARITDSKPATVTNMLKPLESRGLIARRIDKKTNRAMIVALTSKGAALAESVHTAWQSIEARLIATVPRVERSGLFKRLEDILGALGGAPPPRPARRNHLEPAAPDTQRKLT